MASLQPDSASRSSRVRDGALRDNSMQRIIERGKKDGSILEGSQVQAVPQKPFGPRRQKRKFILCFDGTGNKFTGTHADSNILKIYRMLDRGDDSQFHYYQPGIGTYVTSKSWSHTGHFDRMRSWYLKAKDSAVGSSFAEHVMGGYKFLMRYYTPGDDIYMFGFSRGAYTARFLAEMLDHVGLLSSGNEEMCRFAWKTFQSWQVRQEETHDDRVQKKHLLDFMMAFRETFSRPVCRIRFLGLFDTVNSVPAFEAAWMQRSKFPYTARTSAKVIRHAVAIDERRAKFRQDLIGEIRHAQQDRHHYRRRRRQTGLEKFFHLDEDEQKSVADEHEEKALENAAKQEEEDRGRPTLNGKTHSSHLKVKSPAFRHASETKGLRSLSPSAKSFQSAHSSLSAIRGHQVFDDDDSDEEEEQDILEVWFSGDHGDLGGGWPLDPGHNHNLSHVPLVWMVREASRAGLHFDEVKLRALNCAPDDPETLDPSVSRVNDEQHAPGNPQIHIDPASPNPERRDPSQPILALSADGPKEESEFMRVFRAASTQHRVHCSLEYGQPGISSGLVSLYRFMEYLPFRRMDLQPDGSWRSIRWPLPKGEVRDAPNDMVVHNSVIRRMEVDEKYRPGNLIVGGGGRGVKIAPKEYGMGEWKVKAGQGDPVSEVVVRKYPPKVMNGEQPVNAWVPLRMV